VGVLGGGRNGAEGDWGDGSGRMLVGLLVIEGC